VSIIVIFLPENILQSKVQFKKIKKSKLTHFQTSPEVLAILQKAMNALKKRDYNEAEYLVKQALKKHPKYIKSLSFLAYLKFRGADYNEAIRLSQKALKYDSTNKMARMTLGLSHFQQQNISKARKIFLKVIEQYPGDWKAHYQLGLIMRMRDELEQAEKYFIKCIEIKPDIIVCHSELAYTYSQMGKVKQAFNTLSAVLNEHPHRIDAYLSLANIVNITGQHKLPTIEILKQGITFNADSHELIIMLANMLQSIGNDKEADKYRKMALSVSADIKGSPDALAYQLKQQGELLKSADVLQRILDKDPDNLFANYHLGTIYRRLGKPEACPEPYLRILSKSPENFLAIQALGLCYLRGRKYQQAFKYLNKSVDMKPSHIGACINLGLFHQINGDIAAAIERLSICKKLEGTSSKLRRSIRKRIRELRTEL